MLVLFFLLFAMEQPDIFNLKHALQCFSHFVDLPSWGLLQASVVVTRRALCLSGVESLYKHFGFAPICRMSQSVHRTGNKP